MTATTLEGPFDTITSSQVKAIALEAQGIQVQPKLPLNDIVQQLWDQSNEMISTIEDEVPPSVQLEADEQRITIQKIRIAWESVRKRVKQITKSGLVTAYLSHCEVISIEGSDDLPVIIVQVKRQVSYTLLMEHDRWRALEPALTEEFGLPCKVKVVSPDYKPPLTVEEVNNVWEIVIKRTKQKTSTAMAAMLRLSKILRIEGTTERAIIVIQLDKQGHYNYIRSNDRYKELEWAFTEELGRPCQVQILPPP